MDYHLDLLFYDASDWGWIDQFMIGLSGWGYKGVILLILLFLFFQRTRRLGMVGLTAGVCGFLITQLIRLLIPRERPFVAVEEVVALIPKEASSSFPSAQGLLAGIFIGMLWLLPGKWRWGGLATGVLIMISRVYVGHHYLSDVLVGGLIGTTLVFILHKTLPSLPNGTFLLSKGK
ncbi:phosphatase PAP2 family protein [Halobacillus fulvus]|nr:phosphatase PAP2 family protein [Halobacillus fulvus]